MSNQRHLAAVSDDQNADVVLDEHYPDKFLDCRTLQHDWRRIGCYHAYGEVVRVLHCHRCGTDRRDHWSPSGHRLSNATYDYPDGYSIGNGGAALPDLRRESLRRTTVYDSEAALNAVLFGGRKRKSAG